MTGAGSGWTNLFTYRPRGDVFPGSWQRDVRISPDEMRKHHAVFACESQIASDIGKLRPYLRQRSANGQFWQEVQNPAYSPVLSQPNSYQDRGQFLESWIWSKLNTGNAYLLKQRDGRGVVVALYPLDPFRVLPLVSTDNTSQVFYQLSADNLTPGLTAETSIVVPAREIVHDRMNTLHHPLVGVSPLFAAGAAAAGGLAMANSSARFFQKGQTLSGVLTAPGAIDPDTAKRLEDRWDNDFAGSENAGKIAVLGSGLEFKTMQLSMVDSQIVELMKWSSAQICSVFAMPQWKISLDTWPRGIIDVASLNVEYLSACLQRYIEATERCLTAGLGLGNGMSVALDETGLLRMNPAAMVAMLAQAVGSAQMTPNEARAKLNLPPVPGGDQCFLQQQNFSLEALAKRDALANPFGAGQPALPPPA